MPSRGPKTAVWVIETSAPVPNETITQLTPERILTSTHVLDEVVQEFQLEVLQDPRNPPKTWVAIMCRYSAPVRVNFVEVGNILAPASIRAWRRFYKQISLAEALRV